MSRIVAIAVPTLVWKAAVSHTGDYQQLAKLNDMTESHPSVIRAV